MSKTFFSWNVNGIRAAIKKGFIEWFEETEPDVLSLQEIKAQESQIGYKFPGYHRFCYPAQKKGYSGTLLLSKEEPIEVNYGLGREEHDREGRVITAQYPSYFLVNVYTPNSQRGLTRLEYRTEVWDNLFGKYLKKLETMKPVIVCGDLNVAHKEIDLANPKTNTRNAGFTIEERTSFDKYIQDGFIDTFREFDSAGGNYTWWSYRSGARSRNVGWRIDYFLVSPSLRPRLKDAQIHSEILGSDHCPISITLSRMSHKSSTALRNTGTGAGIAGERGQFLNPALACTIARNDPDRARSSIARYEVCEACRLTRKKKGRTLLAEFSAHKTGNNLLSHSIGAALPSAIEGLTAVVGMGTGVSPHRWSPEWVQTYFQGYCPYVIEPVFRARKKKLNCA